MAIAEETIDLFLQILASELSKDEIQLTLEGFAGNSLEELLLSYSQKEWCYFLHVLAKQPAIAEEWLKKFPHILDLRAKKTEEMTVSDFISARKHIYPQLYQWIKQPQQTKRPTKSKAPASATDQSPAKRKRKVGNFHQELKKLVLGNEKRSTFDEAKTLLKEQFTKEEFVSALKEYNNYSELTVGFLFEEIDSEALDHFFSEANDFHMLLEDRIKLIIFLLEQEPELLHRPLRESEHMALIHLLAKFTVENTKILKEESSSSQHFVKLTDYIKTTNPTLFSSTVSKCQSTIQFQNQLCQIIDRGLRTKNLAELESFISPKTRQQVLDIFTLYNNESLLFMFLTGAGDAEEELNEFHFTVLKRLLKKEPQILFAYTDSNTLLEHFCNNPHVYREILEYIQKNSLDVLSRSEKTELTDALKSLHPKSQAKEAQQHAPASTPAPRPQSHLIKLDEFQQFVREMAPEDKASLPDSVLNKLTNLGCSIDISVLGATTFKLKCQEYLLKRGILLLPPNAHDQPLSQELFTTILKTGNVTYISDIKIVDGADSHDGFDLEFEDKECSLSPSTVIVCPLNIEHSHYGLLIATVKQVDGLFTMTKAVYLEPFSRPNMTRILMEKRQIQSIAASTSAELRAHVDRTLNQGTFERSIQPFTEAFGLRQENFKVICGNQSYGTNVCHDYVLLWTVMLALGKIPLTDSLEGLDQLEGLTVSPDVIQAVRKTEVQLFGQEYLINQAKVKPQDAPRVRELLAQHTIKREQAVSNQKVSTLSIFSRPEDTKQKLDGVIIDESVPEKNQFGPQQNIQ